MNSLKRPWTNLILAPIWFLINIVAASIYFGGIGINEPDIPSKITENTPLLILITQVLLLSTLLITTRKDGFNILEMVGKLTKQNYQKTFWEEYYLVQL